MWGWFKRLFEKQEASVIAASTSPSFPPGFCEVTLRRHVKINGVKYGPGVCLVPIDAENDWKRGL